MTKSDLKQYQHRAREIEQLVLELEGVRNALVGVKSPVLSLEPKGASARDKTAKLLDKLIRLEKLLDSKMDARYNLQLRIEHAIDALPPLEANIMRLYYINGYSWERVAVEVNYSIHHIWRLHGKALKKMRENER